MSLKKKNIWLLVNSLIVTAYIIFAVQINVKLMESYEADLIIAVVIFIPLLVVHVGILVLGGLFQWIGFFKGSKGLIIFSSIVMFVGSLILYWSLFWMIPFLISNLLSVFIKPKAEKEQML